MTANRRFHKGEALGNDYVVVRRESFSPLDFQLVESLCRRHTGIGADGIIEVLRVEHDHAEVVVWNADGTTAEVSGNGLRIAAIALADTGWRGRKLLSAGRTYAIEIAGDRVAITLPPARLQRRRERFELEGLQFALTEVDVGNPHVVIAAGELAESAWASVAAAIERHPQWPHRTNVERVTVVDAATIAIEIHERGVGPTTASGTGACAATVAAVANGWVTTSSVEVQLRGGCVRVQVDPSGVRLEGIVRLTFVGEIRPDW